MRKVKGIRKEKREKKERMKRDQKRVERETCNMSSTITI